MSKIRKAAKAILTIAIMYKDRSAKKKAENKLIKKYGNVLLRLPEYPFTHSSYYEKEMGENLYKTILAFENPQAREKIVSVKYFADKVERKLSPKGKRLVNIDPGHLHLENFILVTGKNFTHRIHLQKGVYADLTLIYSKKEKSFKALPWTYSDYKSENVIRFLNDVRKTAIDDLR